MLPLTTVRLLNLNNSLLSFFLKTFLVIYMEDKVPKKKPFCIFTTHRFWFFKHHYYNICVKYAMKLIFYLTFWLHCAEKYVKAAFIYTNCASKCAAFIAKYSMEYRQGKREYIALAKPLVKIPSCFAISGALCYHYPLFMEKYGGSSFLPFVNYFMWDTQGSICHILSIVPEL